MMKCQDNGATQPELAVAGSHRLRLGVVKGRTEYEFAGTAYWCEELNRCSRASTTASRPNSFKKVQSAIAVAYAAPGIRHAVSADRAEVSIVQL